MSASIVAAARAPAELPASPPRPPDPVPPASAAPTRSQPPSHSVPKVLGALGGMAALGLATSLGSGNLSVIGAGTLLLLASLLGAVLLTAPALLALHQFLQLSARPERMVAALAHALVAGGNVALGVAPVGLFFAVTTSLWPLVLLLGFALCGVITAVVAVGSLRAVETAATAPPSSRFGGLLVGWAALTTLISLRIGFDVLTLVFAGGLS